jgi:hypothetical protein
MIYVEYVEWAKRKGHQPLSEVAFNAMVRAGFRFDVGDFAS